MVFKNVESETPLSLKKVRSYHILFVRIIITLLNRFRLVEYAHREIAMSIFLSSKNFVCIVSIHRLQCTFLFR